MALLDFHPGRSLSGALLALLEIHPAAMLGARRERRDVRRHLAQMPSYLLDDIGVSTEGHVKPDDELERLASMTAAMRT